MNVLTGVGEIISIVAITLPVVAKHSRPCIGVPIGAKDIVAAYLPTWQGS